MKKIITIAIIIASLTLCLTFSGCEISTNEETVVDEPNIGKFILLHHKDLSNGLDQYIFYDPQTMVMYTFCSQYNYAGGLTVMYNADGTPKLYSPETK